MNFIRQYGLCYCWAEQATHDAISADASVIVMSPLFGVASDWLPWLDTPVSNLPDLSTARQKLEAIGLNFGWVTGEHTCRDILRYIRKFLIFEQRLWGDWVDNNAGIIEVIKLHIDSTVNTLSPALREQAKDWMAARGLAVGWITNQTTVREVLHFIVQNLNLPVAYFYSEVL